MHRRNASLHHFSFLMTGMAKRGWSPVVDFWFDNQAVVGVPGKGCYVFYDKDQLKSGVKYKNIQDSIDSNPAFVKDFQRRTDEIFGALFFKCLDIETDNLSLLSDKELHRLYLGFIDAMTVGPLITVQLFGIEACFDENYRIIQFLRKRLQELGKGKEFETYKGILSVNIGETVAFTEKKNFYQVAAEMAKNKDIYALFQNESLQEISEKLKKYPRENALFERHTKKYEWVNTEYVSGGWSREKWIGEFKTALTDVLLPDEQLKIILQSFEDLNAERKKTIEELAPPKDVLHALNCLSELIAQRDWTKGYFTKALLSYNVLLDEIARRIGKTREDILLYSYHEIEAYFLDGTIIPQEEIDDRKSNGFVILIKHGSFELVTGKKKIQEVIESEKISEPFEKVAHITEFKGLGVSRGCIRGKVRVLEDASKISELVEGEILVTYMTTIEFIPAFRKAAAVVTDEGGMSCHAAIVSREFKLPCVVGTKVATRVLETGDEVEVDADNGKVKILTKHSFIQQT